MIRVALADDHAHYRTGIKQLLESEPGFTVSGEACSPAEAITVCTTERPQILLLDVAMCGGSGLELLSQLRDLALGVRVLILTTGISRQDLIQALRLGAYGVVTKDAPAPLLLKSIRRVRAGEFWIGRDLVADLVHALNSGVSSAAPASAPRVSQPFGLTPRELAVVGAVSSGYTNRQMAAQFGVAEDTIKHHLTNIFDKTGVSNRLELALFAIHHRLTQG